MACSYHGNRPLNKGVFIATNSICVVLTHLGVVVMLPWKPCILVTTLMVSVVTKLIYPRGIKYKHHLEHPIFDSVLKYSSKGSSPSGLDPIQ